MAYKRRRRQKGTWFPVLGQATADANDQPTIGTFFLDIDTGGGVTTGVVPLIPDIPQDEPSQWDDFNEGLGGILGNEYFLSRIVGKFFIWVEEPPQLEASNFPLAYLVTAGFFISRADGTSVNIPIGFSNQPRQYDPGSCYAVREPWIWRRSWILGTTRNTGALGANDRINAKEFPKTTAGYGSVLDGGHVDAKTKRRVSSDDRLWLAVSARAFPVLDQQTYQLTGAVQVNHDLRVFGSLRRARNRGVF